MRGAAGLTVVAAFLLSGCGVSLFSSDSVPEEESAVEEAAEVERGEVLEPPVNEVAQDNQLASLASTEASPEPPLESPEVSIVWKVGEGDVGYVIHYGTSRDALDREVIVEVSELTPVEGPNGEPVYQYRLRGTSRTEPLFVALSAFAEDGVSEMSEVFEVKPDTK